MRAVILRSIKWFNWKTIRSLSGLRSVLRFGNLCEKTSSLIPDLTGEAAYVAKSFSNFIYLSRRMKAEESLHTSKGLIHEKKCVHDYKLD